jgi:hypothetical protein
MQRSKLMMVAGALVLAMAVGGAAVAVATNDNGEVIHACVNNHSGTVQIVDSPDDCQQNWSPLNWNQQGPAGTDGMDGTDGTNGMDGTDGTNGMDGTDGAPGISGYEQVVQTEMLVDAQVGDFIIAHVACPDGKKVLGGGAQGFIFAVVVSSSPLAGDDSQWVSIFRVTAASSVVPVSAHAICGFVAS